MVIPDTLLLQMFSMYDHSCKNKHAAHYMPFYCLFSYECYTVYMQLVVRYPNSLSLPKNKTPNT